MGSIINKQTSQRAQISSQYLFIKQAIEKQTPGNLSNVSNLALKVHRWDVRFFIDSLLGIHNACLRVLDVETILPYVTFGIDL